MARFYIRPIGRVVADVAIGFSSPSPSGGKSGGSLDMIPWLAVAGRKDLLFTAAELVTREGVRIDRQLVSAADLRTDSPPAFTSTLAAFQHARAPIAGVTLDRPRIMGIVNVTPDSFSDGGRYLAADAAIAHGLQLEEEGADILDIGGESTRPGAEPIGFDEECRRVLPVIEALAKRARVPISIDTRNAEVMRRAAEAGARIINDVSALSHDAKALEVAAASGLPVILMHAQGDPRTMQVNPTYDDVVLDVYDSLASRITACERGGIPRERLVVDPGIGFGKTLAHNVALLGSLSIFHGLGCAILLGASRKSFLARLTGAHIQDRLGGSIAAALQAVAQGVQIVRVHDVAATRQAIAVGEASSRQGSLS